MNIIELSGSINAQSAQAIERLFLETFEVETDPNFLERVNEKHKLLVSLAYLEDNLVGFKIGYQKHRGTFFSWLGAVSPKHRRKGIARALLHHQHSSCKSAGYKEIQTEASGKNTSMLTLNLQEGFSIFGTHLGHNDEIAVQLRKQL